MSQGLPDPALRSVISSSDLMPMLPARLAICLADSYPSFFSRRAATAESTPPDIATAIFRLGGVALLPNGARLPRASKEGRHIKVASCEIWGTSSLPADAPAKSAKPRSRPTTCLSTAIYSSALVYRSSQLFLLLSNSIPVLHNSLAEFAATSGPAVVEETGQWWRWLDEKKGRCCVNLLLVWLPLSLRRRPARGGIALCVDPRSSPAQFD
jgi:hypothetical protein